MNEDLRALRDHTERELPDLERTIQRARLRRERSTSPWREWLMSSTHVMKRRPWLTTALAVVAIAIVLLAVPISYTRTIGHQVDLSIAGAGLGQAEIAAIAHELKAALHAGHVVVRAENQTLVWSASVPTRALADPGPMATAMAKELSAKGYAASAVSKPIQERVSGSVYAFARDQMITVETAGKSAAQIESEIRQRFAEAGVPDAKVSVTDEADGKRKVEIEVQRPHEAAGAPETNFGLQLTKNGAPMAGQGFEVKVMHKKSESGTVLSVEVTDGSRTATAQVPIPNALGDAGTAAEIERQLAAAGIQARVTMNGDRIEIEKR